MARNPSKDGMRFTLSSFRRFDLWARYYLLASCGALTVFKQNGGVEQLRCVDRCTVVVGIDERLHISIAQLENDPSSR